MPRKHPLPKREAEISSRLKSFRESLSFPRRLFAIQAGLDSSTIVRIELGRAPVKYEAARQLCICHLINPVWLATGVDSIRWPGWLTFADLPPLEEIGASRQALFSDVYDQYFAPKLQAKVARGLPESPKDLAGHVELLGNSIALMMAGPAHSPQSLALALRQLLLFPLRDEPINQALTMKAARYLIEWLCAELIPSGFGAQKIKTETLSSILAPGRFLHAHYEEVLRLASKSGPARNSDLTYMSTFDNLLAVNQWHRLKARIQKATGCPGEKSTLAKFLGVDLTQISRWLSNSGPEPGADYALKMLQWVQERESK